MPKGSYLSSILRSNKTVFTTEDIALLWHEPNTTAARVRLHYYVKKGDLYRIRNGLYAKSEDYNKLELATRILTPAYVSFETVLAREGLIFQYYEPIFVASYTNRQMVIDQQTYSFRKIKMTVLTDPIGIEHSAETSIATKERALLDMLYVSTEYHFDNLRAVDWDKIFQILPIYKNQHMLRITQQLFQSTRQETP